MLLSSIADIESLRGFLQQRFGVMPGAAPGVLHVAAVWRPPGEDRNVVLRICDATPKSEVDFLLLNLARARAEAIVTTGRILREEPGLTHDLQGERGAVHALDLWRREALGLEQPPWLAVLTSGRDLDAGHPALGAWARPVLYCPAASADELRRRLRGGAGDVVGLAQPSLAAAIAHLRRERGACRISIEAGPSTAGAGYRPPALVDELLLSIYGGKELPPELAAGELPRGAELERVLGPRRASFSMEQASGRWTFEHYRCAIVRGDSATRGGVAAAPSSRGHQRRGPAPDRPA